VTGVIAAAPALPLHTAGPYVAAAYVVFVALILVYVAIMARKQMRTERDLQALRRELAERDDHASLDEPAPHRTPSQEAHRTPSQEAHHTPSQEAHRTPSQEAHRTPSQEAHRTPSQEAHRTPSQESVA
jgi:hypothetical protein